MSTNRYSPVGAIVAAEVDNSDIIRHKLVSRIINAYGEKS